MAKSKRRSRQEAAKRSASESKEADSSPPAIEPNPPRPNRTLLIVSGVLMVGWLVYLLLVALFGRGANP